MEGSDGVPGNRLDVDLVASEDAGICIDCVESGSTGGSYFHNCGIMETLSTCLQNSV